MPDGWLPVACDDKRNAALFNHLLKEYGYRASHTKTQIVKNGVAVAFQAVIYS
jgi:hypothetical protein